MKTKSGMFLANVKAPVSKWAACFEGGQKEFDEKSAGGHQEDATSDHEKHRKQCHDSSDDLTFSETSIGTLREQGWNCNVVTIDTHDRIWTKQFAAARLLFLLRAVLHQGIDSFTEL